MISSPVLIDRKGTPVVSPCDAALAFGGGYTPNNPNNKPKERYGCGIQRDIQHNAYSGNAVTKEIVFVAVSHNDNESGRP